MRDDDPGAGDGAVPKLTLGQRILTALPSLQRAPTTRAPTTRASTTGAPTTRASRPSPTSAGSGPTKKPGPRPAMSKAAETDGAAETAGAVEPDGVVEPDEVIEPDEVVAPNGSSTNRTDPSSTRTGGQARSGAGQTRAPARGGAGTNPYEGMSRAELERGMKYLDDQERRFALLIGPLLAVLDIILTLVTLHNNPPLHVHGHLNKLHANPSTIVALGVGSAVIAGLVTACAWFRRRSLTIFALLFSGYGGGLLTMLPSWAMAGWLFVHFSRMQKALRALGGGTRPRGRVPAKPGEAAHAGAAAARARSRDRTVQRRDRGRKQPAPAGPSASKRYTPPRPARPRPPAPS